MPIIQERLNRVLNELSLRSGSHSPDSKMCVMEAVAYVSGEPWSDSPACVSPVLGAFMRAWNDALPSDAERDRLLKPLIPRLVGTANGTDVETRRALMAADWFVRVHCPTWLRLAGLTSQAESLEKLPEITSMAQIPSVRGPLKAVRKDASAARDAARAAAWAAAWDAASAAARDAAGDAARDAAKKRLAPTVTKLRASGFDLLERMLNAA